MNAAIGWALAALAVAIGYWVYGWPGVALAVSVIVFWLLLQFSRALRAMRAAAQAPVGRVASAVMVHAALHKGQRLMELIRRTRSLGQRVENAVAGREVFAWSDDSGARVTVMLQDGRVVDWVLDRHEEAAADAAAPEA